MAIRSKSNLFGELGLLSLTLAFLLVTAHAQTNASVDHDRRTRAVIAEFEEDARDYLRLRERLRARLPKLPKQATSEQIEAHKIALQKSVQAARGKRKQGEIFSRAASKIIVKMIKEEFKGRDITELRKTVALVETKGVPLKVNVPYPEDKELLEMSPALLLVLPKLPDHVRYRFVNRNLMLIDEECGLIIDFMPNAFV